MFAFLWIQKRKQNEINFFSKGQKNRNVCSQKKRNVDIPTYQCLVISALYIYVYCTVVCLDGGEGGGSYQCLVISAQTDNSFQIYMENNHNATTRYNKQMQIYLFRISLLCVFSPFFSTMGNFNVAAFIFRTCAYFDKFWQNFCNQILPNDLDTSALVCPVLRSRSFFDRLWFFPSGFDKKLIEK